MICLLCGLLCVSSVRINDIHTHTIQVFVFCLQMSPELGGKADKEDSADSTGVTEPSAPAV